MTVLNFLNNEKETLSIKDLTEFFIKDEVCEDYRDQVYSFEKNLVIKKSKYIINKTNEEWTLVCKDSDKQVLMLYSNEAKVVFFNKSVLSHVILDEIIRFNNMNRSFFIIDGLFNNTTQTKIGEYTCIDSIYFEKLTKQELFKKINEEYTANNQERLIEEGSRHFESKPTHDTDALLAEWKHDALNGFLCSKKPREVMYHLKNDYHLVSREFLTEDVVTNCFEYFNRAEEYIEEMKKNPEVTLYEIEDNFRVFMTQEIYRENEEDWLIDLDLLAVREISKLEQEGKLNQFGRKANKPIEMEVVLKGEKVKRQAWITQPTISQGYRFQKHYSPLKFSLARHATTNEFLSFDKIQEIYVNGGRVFSYTEFIQLMKVKQELDKAQEEESSHREVEIAKKAEMDNYKELITVAIEKVSKKNKIVEGQMALNLFF